MFFCAKLLFYCTQLRFAQLSNKAYDNDDDDMLLNIYLLTYLLTYLLSRRGRISVK